MMEISSNPLKIALHGVEEQMAKAIKQLLQEFGSSACVIENFLDADVHIFDGDSPTSLIRLERHIQERSSCPAIVFSLHIWGPENLIYLNKPVNGTDLLSALHQASVIINKNASVVFDASTSQQLELEWQHALGLKPGDGSTLLYSVERKTNASRFPIVQLSEKELDDYIDGFDIDTADPKQLDNACYDPLEYYQGLILMALSECREKNKIFLLESDWQPILLFPATNELWVDASDQEIKAFAGLKVKHKKMATAFSLKQLDPVKVDLTGTSPNFQGMDAFMWKLACWTSLGRYPKEIDYKVPVYLTHWPNFTRLLVTPYALGITAILAQGPETMLNIANKLKIKPHYVFMFLSAAYAIGLVGQAKRALDIRPNKGKSFRNSLFTGSFLDQWHRNA